MSDLHYSTATELAEKIKNKQLGCLEILELYFSRIEKFNDTLNAIIILDKEGARSRANEADKALAKGELWGPFHGVPMSIKESFDVAGQPSTFGVPAYK
ncbi:MAG: amidase family protein, partial [Alphaproteobacteria bacterium]|nr:amidase family protein [Alphaproteobacteria bacterium]